MRKGRSFIKTSRRGKVKKVKKVVREHYLRDDICCGSVLCSECNHLSEPVLDNVNYYTDNELPLYLVLDTNVLLHQMDVIASQPPFRNVIFLQNVLEEVNHRSPKLHARARSLATNVNYTFSNEHHRATYVERQTSESPNDRNDRAIRVATQWYMQHLQGKARVLLITNDIANRDEAVKVGIEALTLGDFVRKSLADKYPQLLEVLAAAATEGDNPAVSMSTNNTGLYADYVPRSQWEERVMSGELFKGTFKVNRNHWSDAYVSIRRGKEHARVVVSGVQNMNRAFDNDVVVVELLDEPKWDVDAGSGVSGGEVKMDEKGVIDLGIVADVESAADTHESTKPFTGVTKARVVAIAERKWKSYCGSLEETDKKHGNLLFFPVNRLIPRIRIESRQIEQLMDKRIMVQVDAWPKDSKFPLGHYVRTLGKIGDRDTETQVILIEHDVSDAPFSNNVMKCLPSDEYDIGESDIAGRLDLRTSKTVFSIDPPGCKDIDDALHVTPLDNGNFEVGVHIADVTHYMKPDTALDEEAQQRGTSVYLVDRRIDMIPTRLSTDLCSLVANVDRLAFSVIWELTSDADIVKVSFGKTVIRSVAALAYKDAQAHLDADPSTDDNVVGNCCRMLGSLARALRQKRMAAGALELASMEVKFLLDEQSQQPLDVEMYQLKAANQLVEEFMLLANISVARRTLEHFPSYALLRRHPAPPVDSFNDLIRAAKLKGFAIDASTSGALAASLSSAHIPDLPIFNKMLRVMATRCMMQAVYTSSGDVVPDDYRHYGLATDVYTHFTSPIRRYADVVVHRLLATCLGIDPLPSALQDRDGVSHMCDTINHRHRMAQQVSRSSSVLYTLMYFRGKQVEEAAMIISVRQSGIGVVVPKYGIEGSIKFSTESDSRTPEECCAQLLKYDEDTLSVTLSDGNSYAIFDDVRVRIYVKQSKMRREWLVVELLGHNDTPEGKRAKLNK